MQNRGLIQESTNKFLGSIVTGLTVLIMLFTFWHHETKITPSKWSTVLRHCEASHRTFSDGAGHWAVSQCQQVAIDAERRRRGHPLATSHTDDCFIVNSALQNQMITATQLHAHLREVRGNLVLHQTIWNCLHQRCLHARWVPNHTTRHRYIILHGLGSIYCTLDEGPMDLSTVLWRKSIHTE